VLYFAEAGWHNDDGIGVKGLKFAAYFDHLGASNGALRFVPCSHYDPVRSELRAYQLGSHGDFPGVVVKSRPGDVVAFDLHAFHASFGGRDRLAWAIEYLAVPDDKDAERKTLRWMADAFEQSPRDFDQERYPSLARLAGRRGQRSPARGRHRASPFSRVSSTCPGRSSVGERSARPRRSDQLELARNPSAASCLAFYLASSSHSFPTNTCIKGQTGRRLRPSSQPEAPMGPGCPYRQY
jgi:Phytanoyl-CoA dioxygenase (PhyH)